MSTHIWRFFRNSDILENVYKYAKNNQRGTAEMGSAHCHKRDKALKYPNIQCWCGLILTH
jgi:hypothetical protein